MITAQDILNNLLPEELARIIVAISGSPDRNAKDTEIINDVYKELIAIVGLEQARAHIDEIRNV